MAKVFSIQKDNWYVCILSAHNHEGGVAFAKDKIYQSPKDEYLVRDDNGQPEIIGAFMMEHFRPWTVKDAKPGDFLTYATEEGEDRYFIFKSEYKPYDSMYHYYAGFAKEFIPVGTGCLDEDSFRPSTEEEKELLLSKIQENGYIWDAENCKLINTSVKTKKEREAMENETIINLFIEYESRAVEETGLVHGYIRQVIRNFLNGYEEPGNYYFKWEVVRIIEKAMKHKDDGVKTYARKLADKYHKEGHEEFADAILSAIGEKEVAMATMDDDQCASEGIEELARFIRGHLAEIPENAQKVFERIYTRTTGKKMYGGFKD